MSIDDERETTRGIAERLFEAFRAVRPFKRRPGFDHTARPGEFQLIHRLAHEAQDEGLRVGDLAAWLGVKPPTVTQLADAVDRRAIRVRLSPAGRAMADSFHAHAMEETEAIVAHLGIEDGEKLAELLSRTAEFLSSRHGAGYRCPHHNDKGEN